MNLNQLGGGGNILSPQNIGNLEDCSLIGTCPCCGDDIDLDEADNDGQIQELRDRVQELGSVVGNLNDIVQYWYDEAEKYKNQLPNVRVNPLDSCNCKPFSGVKQMQSNNSIFDVSVLAITVNDHGVQSEKVLSTVSGILAPDSQTASFLAGLEADDKVMVPEGARLCIRTRAY